MPDLLFLAIVAFSAAFIGSYISSWLTRRR